MERENKQSKVANETSDCTSIIDELDKLDENSKFWKTPSAQRTMQGGVISSVLEMLSSVFYSIYIIIIARGSVSDSELLAVIGTMLIMLRYFAYLGFTAAGSKYLSEYLARDKKVARYYAKAACKYNFYVTGFPIIAFTIWLYFTQPKNEVEQIAYFTLIITIIADRLRSNTSIYIVGYKRQDLAAYAYWIPDMFMYVCAIITYLLFGVVGPLLSFMVFEVIMLFTSIWAMKKCSDFPLSDMFAWGESYGLFWKLFKFNFLFSLANLAFALLTSTLLITGGKLLGVLTASEISALYMLTSLINPLFNFFNMVGPIMQGVSEAFALKNKKLMENYTLISLKFPLFLLVAYIAFTILFGREIISFFYGSRWIMLGLAILIVLLPGYLFGAFASRFDNIIAGVNRPQAVIIPWLSALVIAIFALAFARNLPELYLIDYYIGNDPMNYGISLRFIFIIGLSSLAMVVFGIIILIICFKILGVKIPKDFLWKPALVAAILMVFFYFLIQIGVVNIFINTFGTDTGGIVYILVMAILGLFLYATLSILFDSVTIEDARFWAKIIQRMGPLSFIYPLFKPYAKWLFKHQIQAIKSKPFEWITSYDKETIIKDALFKISILPGKKISASNQDIRTKASETLDFKIQVKDSKITLFDIVIYAKIDFKIVKAQMKSIKRIDAIDCFEIEYSLTLDPTLSIGYHELSIVFEAFESPNLRSKKRDDEIQPLAGFDAFTDTRFLWYHDQEFKLTLEG